MENDKTVYQGGATPSTTPLTLAPVTPGSISSPSKPLTPSDVNSIINNTPVETSPSATDIQTPPKPAIVSPNPVETSPIGASAATDFWNNKIKTDIQSQQDQAEATAEANLNASKSDVQSLVEGITGVQKTQPALEENYQIPEKTLQLQDITSQIDAKKFELQQKIAALNSSGATQAGVQDQVQELTRVANIDIANLSIQQLALSGYITAAQGIVDHKVQLELAPLQTQLATAQQFYNDNKDLFTKAQDRQFQANLQVQQQQYDIQKQDRTLIGQAQVEAAQNGAPQDVIKAMGNAATVPDAVSAAQGYLTSGNFQITTDPATGEPIVFNAKTGQIVGGNNNGQSFNGGGTTPAVANNNPGNLKNPDGTFKSFPTMQAGFQALEDDLKAKMTGATSTSLTPQSTIQDFANVYAPKSDGNDPVAYAQSIASQLGVPVTTQIGNFTNNIRPFALAVAKNEDSTAAAKIGQENQPASTSTANQIISQAPAMLQPAMSFTNSTGDVYIDQSKIPDNLKILAQNYASKNNIPILSSSQVSDLQSLDTAIANINQVQSKFSEIAPFGPAGKIGSALIEPWSKIFNTDYGSKVKAYQTGTFEAALNSLKIISGSSRLSQFTSSISGDSLPQFKKSIGQAVGGDTLKDGLNKIATVKGYLNDALHSLIPNAAGVPIPTTQTINSNGMMFVVNTDGSATRLK